MLNLNSTLKGAENCANLQKITQSFDNVERSLNEIKGLTADKATIDAVNNYLVTIPDKRTQFRNKYQTECGATQAQVQAQVQAQAQRNQNIRRRNEYVATYNREIEDAHNYRRDAFAILRRNGSQSDLCSAFVNERSALYRAHTALFNTFGLVPDMDYRGEQTKVSLEKEFDQNKLDISAEVC